MPSFFTPFLEEKTGSEENLKQLEHDRKHICEGVKMMQDRLKLIDKRIAEIKKEDKKDLPRAPE
jgi:hypothetical protein